MSWRGFHRRIRRLFALFALSPVPSSRKSVSKFALKGMCCLVRMIRCRACCRVCGTVRKGWRCCFVACIWCTATELPHTLLSTDSRWMRIEIPNAWKCFPFFLLFLVFVGKKAENHMQQNKTWLVGWGWVGLNCLILRNRDAISRVSFSWSLRMQ